MATSPQNKHQIQKIISNNLSSLVSQNRLLITQLPALLIRHIQHYEKIHESNCDQLTTRMPFSETVQQEINAFKECSLEFVNHLAIIKSNFNAILTKQSQNSNKSLSKKSSNFETFITDHCQSVVRQKIDKIKIIIPEQQIYDANENKI